MRIKEMQMSEMTKVAHLSHYSSQVSATQVLCNKRPQDPASLDNKCLWFMCLDIGWTAHFSWTDSRMGMPSTVARALSPG